jgi:crotonobetainyl-CoA:carnitine CoA-transferase CaiB-like acyl-CoA transferase
VRIADLGIITAGASATQVLADLGADVIKVESARYLDPFRHWPSGAQPSPGHERLWDASPPFNVVNRSKRGVSLDLKHPLGREAFLRLVAISDVVVENFRRGVMEKLELGYESLRKVRPDLVMASFGSQGRSGPEAGYSSYGSTLDALSGIMSITGYGPDTPTWSSHEVNYPDQIVPLFGVAMILAGLHRRRLTGKGAYIDLSQRELTTSMLGEVLLDYTVNGRVRQPQANRDFSMMPHGVYRCLGEDEWVAIAVEDDNQWMRLCAVIGRADLVTDGRYATLTERRKHADEIDALLAEWTGKNEKRTAMEVLQRAGVPAGAVLNGRDMLDDPQLKARKFYRLVEHPVGGPQMQRGWPFHLSQTPAEVRSPAPCFGEHTHEVLGGLLGYSEEEIVRLEAAGVIGYRPA